MHSNSTAVDFAIITALEEELKAVLARFSGYRKRDKDGQDTHTYYEVKVRSTRADRASYSVIITSLSDMGPLPAAQKAQAVVTRWHPRNVLLVGIACGIPGETDLGDVLVSTKVVDYSIEKVYPDGTEERRPREHEASRNLLDSAVNLSPSEWSDLVLTTRPSEGSPEQRKGVIASGPKVVANADLIRSFQERYPKLVGIELEAGGVASGLRDTPEPPAFLMVKGVSDHGEGKETVEAWRSYAAAAAAAFALALIRTGTGPAVRMNRRRIRLWSAIGLMMAVLVLLFALLHRSPRRVEPAVTITPAFVPRPSIAVLNLRNNSGRADAAWLATAIPEMLRRNLATNGKLRIVPGEDVARMTGDLSINGIDDLPLDIVQRIQKTLHVESIVAGSFRALGNPGSGLVEIDLRVINAADGKVRLTCPPATGTEDKVFDVVSDAATYLREGAHLGALSPEETVAWHATFGYSRDAIRLYSDGLAKFRHYDALGARPLLRDASHVAPAFPLAHFTLSEVDSALGETPEAIIEADRAVKLSERLRLVDELKRRFQARAHEARFERDKAADVYTELSASFPNKLEYGLLAVRAQIENNKLNEARGTLAELRRTLPSPLLEDPRIDIAEASTLQDSDAVEQKQLAIRAGSKARAIGARSLRGRALMLEAAAYQTLGQAPAMAPAVQEAQSIFDTLGDRSNLAQVTEIRASALDNINLEEERRLLDDALHVHQQLGDKRSVARVTLNIGTNLVFQGRSDEAQKWFDDAKNTFHAMHDDFAEAVAVSAAGVRMFNRGKLIEAQNRYQDALGGFDDSHRLQRGITKGNIAEVLECLGRLDEAQSMFMDALTLHDKNLTELAYDNDRLGEILALKGNYVAARDRYLTALTLQTKRDVGDKIGAAVSRVALASLSIEQGGSVNEQELRDAQQILEDADAADQSLYSLSVIAEYLLTLGRREEADEIARKLEAVASKVQYERVRLGVAVTTARVLASSGRPEDLNAAMKRLESTAAEAAQHLFMTSEFDARLALGELEVRARRPNARTHLLELGARARQNDFGHVAQRAAVAAARAPQ